MPRRRQYNELSLFDGPLPKIDRKPLKELLAGEPLSVKLANWRKRCAEKKAAANGGGQTQVRECET